MRNPESIFNRSGEENRSKLGNMLGACNAVLKDLEKLLANHKSLGTSSQKFRDRIRFGTRDLQTLRVRLTFHASAISAFLTVLGTGSLGRMETVLEIIMQEIQSGKRESSVLSVVNDDNDEEEGKATYLKLLESDLRGNGFTNHDIESHKHGIKAYLQELATSPRLENLCHNSTESAAEMKFVTKRKYSDQVEPIPLRLQSQGNSCASGDAWMIGTTIDGADSPDSMTIANSQSSQESFKNSSVTRDDASWPLPASPIDPFRPDASTPLTENSRGRSRSSPLHVQAQAHQAASTPSQTLKRRASLAVDELHEEVTDYDYDEHARIKRKTVTRRSFSPAMGCSPVFPSHHSSPSASSPSYGYFSQPQLISSPGPSPFLITEPGSQSPFRYGLPPPVVPVNHQTKTADLGQGSAEISTDAQIVDQIRENRMRRNRTAAERFRQRRREKERETSDIIATLETKIRELDQIKTEREKSELFHRNECQYLRNIIIERCADWPQLLCNRPLSPRSLIDRRCSVDKAGLSIQLPPLNDLRQ